MRTRYAMNLTVTWKFDWKGQTHLLRHSLPISFFFFIDLSKGDELKDWKLEIWLFYCLCWLERSTNIYSYRPWELKKAVRRSLYSQTFDSVGIPSDVSRNFYSCVSSDRFLSNSAWFEFTQGPQTKYKIFFRATFSHIVYSRYGFWSFWVSCGDKAIWIWDLHN